MNEWQDMITTLYKNGCQLCPRECGADRIHGQTGFCGMTDELMAARAALHYWEEPCISGTEGSGAVFFSGCTLRCVFCQKPRLLQVMLERCCLWIAWQTFFGVAGEKSK